jgi:uncharacterized protein YraI/peptidoglycan/xylan/chitin deacetylase (PgdA/CDA1 family)
MRSLAPGSRILGAFGALILVLAIAFSLHVPGEVKAVQTATTISALNLRQQPSTSSAIVRVMPEGASVEITGALIDGWYPVSYDGSVGYAYADYLELSVPSVTTGASARVRVALSLRAGPSTTYARLAVMPAGAIVLLTGEIQDGFWQLTYNGTMGWASSQYLTLLGTAPSPTATLPTTPVPAVTPTSTVAASAKARTIARLNLRSGAGTNFPVLTIIPQGGVVDLLGQVQSGFQHVRYAGYTGWAFGTYLQPLSVSGSVTTTTANVNMRQGPETAQGVLLVIPVGSQVILTGAQAAGYHQVRYNGVTGWVSSAYLAGTGVPPDTAPLEIPVLMYHRIASTPGLYQVTEQTLRSEVAWLAANGYQSVTPDDIMAYLTSGTPLPAKPIMITIDDGNSSDVLFKQILDQYGFAGVWYLTGQSSLPYSEAVIRAMDGAGQVCGHTVNHLDLSFESYSTQLAEIRNNKLFLERVVGHPITCFAYPYGAYNQTTMGIVTSIGFTNAVDAWGGPLKFTPELDRYHLTRINLSGYYTLSEFIGLVS